MKIWSLPEYSFLAAVVALPLVLGACGQSAPQSDDVAVATPERRFAPGPCADVYGGEVCTFAALQGEEVTGFGATVPVASIDAAPPGGEMVWPPQSVAAIPLPSEVKAATGFDHLGVNWEPHGHPPALFMTPHFDFHFYVVSPETVAATDCSDATKPVAAPAGYAMPDIDIPGLGMLEGLCVPLMGMHGMPESELEQVDPFGASLIVGYYAGGFTFFEPMVASARLLERQPFELDIPTLPEVPSGVRAPTSFRALFDAETDSYRLLFTDLGGM